MTTLENAFIYTYLACGVSCITACAVVLPHLKKTSRSKFAYTLLAFTGCLAIHDFSRFTEWYRYYKYGLNYNQYFYFSVLFFYFLIANQTWLFSM